MKMALSTVGALVFLAGLVWFLQGVNLLPGTFMRGNPQWVINGAIAMALGGGLYSFALKR